MQYQSLKAQTDGTAGSLSSSARGMSRQPSIGTTPPTAGAAGTGIHGYVPSRPSTSQFNPPPQPPPPPASRLIIYNVSFDAPHTGLQA